MQIQADESRQVVVHLLRLAGPIIATMISRTVMSFVDFVMVSKLGTEAQAAIVPAGMVLFTVIGMGMGMMTGVNTLVSQSFGRGRHADCGIFTWQGIHIGWIMGLLAAPLVGFAAPLYAWIGHDPAVQDLETIYTQIGVYGVAPSIMAFAIAKFFNGIHRPAIGLAAAVISNVFNIVANYALIFGHFGFEPMGIAGAGWGTLAASILQLLVLLAWYLRPHIDRVFHSRRTWRLNIISLRKLFWVGLPVGLAWLFDLTAWTTFVVLLVGRMFGTDHLAATNLCFRLLELSFMPGVGLGIALLSAVGKAVGERKPHLVNLNVMWARRIVFTYMSTMALVYVVFGRTLAGWFTDDPAVLSIAVNVLLFCAAFQVFDAMHIVYSNALRGAGDVHWPTWMMLACVTTILLCGGYALAVRMPQWASYGPWTAATAYIAVFGSSLWIRFAHGRWRDIDLLGKDGRDDAH